MYKAKDLTGKRFGKLTALEPTDKRVSGYMVWHCKCECGNECYVDSKRLLRGTITDCGCVSKTKKRNDSNSVDITGMVFGSLVVLERAENIGSGTAWHCRCECGNEVIVRTENLRAGRTKSCGCKAHDAPYYRELTGQRIGSLTVVKKTDKRDYKGSIIWLCHCDCGTDVLYSADTLLHGSVVSCGCRKKELCRKINDTLHRVDGTCVERLNLQKPRSDNKCGHVGVHMVSNNSFQAYIGFKGKRYYLGTFSSLEDAVAARKRGERMHRNFLIQYHHEDKG